MSTPPHPSPAGAAVSATDTPTSTVTAAASITTVDVATADAATSLATGGTGAHVGDLLVRSASSRAAIAPALGPGVPGFRGAVPAGPSAAGGGGAAPGIGEEDFAHLHVASSWSMRYGASSPAALVEAAAAAGQSMLALTDRDGLYGAIRFVRAAEKAGVAPIVGVDLALDDDAGTDRRQRSTEAAPAAARPARSRTPVRGGETVDDRRPRVVVLARGAAAGLGAGAGWGALCRLVTATHLRGERGRPRTTRRLLAEAAHGIPHGTADDGSPHVAGGVDTPPVLVLLGPDSDVGRLMCTRPDKAIVLLTEWKHLLGAALVVEVACHDAPPGRPYSASQGRRLWQAAQDLRIPCILTGAVRHATPEGAVTVDVLDAARRLTILDERHLDRVGTTGHVTPAAHMAEVARRITDDPGRARDLLAATLAVARECVQDPRRDVGLGSVHLPEADVLGLAPEEDPQQVLAQRARAGIARCYPHARGAELDVIHARLEDELSVIAQLGYATYFLTVALVCDLIRDAGVRVAARGSGAGSLVNHLIGISAIDPIRHRLLMERFCTPLRAQLPDIDIDVESARRTEMYERILDHFGGERVTCVSMMETYRVRHAIRDVGSVLGLPAVEVDTIAKAFPHIRARDARTAIAELPELSGMGLDAPRMEVLFDLVERLDGMPRHIALHPCGVILSGVGLLDRTPVEASWLGYPMSQFDKDDVEALGLLKLDVLGIRMQSAMAYAVSEIERVEGRRIDLDDRTCVPLDDEATFELVRSTRTLGCFQIESPGQRELVGKFAPSEFEDLVIDISLFRPGPVKSDMITPFLRARQGWSEPEYLHPTLRDALEETCGVVVFHEQVLRIISTTTGITLAEADEVRRALGTTDGQARVHTWWHEQARARGYSSADRDRIWEVLAAFASFGFCKAHAAAFAMPTYQSAWLKTHHTAAFLAGVLTHDPGMYPKRLILDDARTHGVPVLGLDVNASGEAYRVEAVEAPPAPLDGAAAETDEATTGEAGEVEVVAPEVSSVTYGIRVALTDVKGISEAEVSRIVAGQPYAGIEDFARRAQPSRPVLERLVLAGGFDELYGIDTTTAGGFGRRGAITRRDLLLHVAELDRWNRAAASGRGRGRRPSPLRSARFSTSTADVRAAAAAQSQGAAPVDRAEDRSVQLALDMGPVLTPASGLPELDAVERVQAELDILGLDVSAHVLEPYEAMLDALGVVRSRDIRDVRSRSDVLVAGVKVATQTPPVRSGRRVVFVTLDDATGPVDATFFEDVQGPYAMTVFHHWLLLVRGVTRRTGPRGVSLRATAAYDLTTVFEAWSAGGVDAARAVMTPPTVAANGHVSTRAYRHASGFQQSPYADIAPAGVPARQARELAGVGHPTRKLWHSSPGSAGR